MGEKELSLIRIFGLNLLAKSLDIITTLYLVSVYGTSIESNPFTANLINVYGPIVGLLINGAAHMTMVIFLYKYRRKSLLKISAAITFILPLVNIVTIFTML